MYLKLDLSAILHEKQELVRAWKGPRNSTINFLRELYTRKPPTMLRDYEKKHFLCIYFIFYIYIRTYKYSTNMTFSDVFATIICYLNEEYIIYKICVYKIFNIYLNFISLNTYTYLYKLIYFFI